MSTPYPTAIEVSGEVYEINTGYEYALACIALINDPEVSDVERAYGVIGILYKEQPDDLMEACEKAVRYLRRGKELPEDGDTERTPDMDYQLDEMYIRASFRSDYGIDLTTRADMHWWEFMELLTGLTDNCILNRVRDLRNYDTSTIRDASARHKILQAQRDVALPSRTSTEDQKTLDEFYAQLK